MKYERANPWIIAMQIKKGQGERTHRLAWLNEWIGERGKDFLFCEGK